MIFKILKFFQGIYMNQNLNSKFTSPFLIIFQVIEV